MIDRIVGSLRALLELNRAVESLLVDVVAGFSPWLAPIPVAVMSYRHMVGLLDLGPAASLAGAVCIEFLGLSAVSTCVSFWSWNADATKTTRRAPFALAMAAGIFYLAVVITLNAMLDETPTVYRIAKGLIASLSAVAAVILAMRASHARRVDETRQERDRRRIERQANRIAKQAHPLPVGGNGAGVKTR
jgi:hypothetical protein